jgi:hypothetical protein
MKILGITGFLDLVHRPVENTAFHKLDLFPTSGDGETRTVRSLRKANLSHWITTITTIAV